MYLYKAYKRRVVEKVGGNKSSNNCYAMFGLF